MKTLLLDVQNRDVKVLDVEDELNVFYELIDCDCIDIVERKINERYFDIVCDDEALLKDNPLLSAFSFKDNWNKLCGNLLFFKHDDEGNLVGLEQDDVNYIFKNIRNIVRNDDVIRPCLLFDILF